MKSAKKDLKLYEILYRDGKKRVSEVIEGVETYTITCTEYEEESVVRFGVWGEDRTSVFEINWKHLIRHKVIPYPPSSRHKKKAEIALLKPQESKHDEPPPTTSN